MDRSDELPDLVNGMSLDTSKDSTDVSGRIDILLRDVSGLFSSIYEIEELRHANSTNIHDTSGGGIDKLVARLDGALSSIQDRQETLKSSFSIFKETETVKEDMGELQEQLEKLLRARELLRAELKEDGWLIRFRTTAEQAEAMMDPLQKSLAACTALLDSHQIQEASAVEMIYTSHESMKATYVPSVTKILKMLKKGVQERSTQNGEALRRMGEMQSRWATLSRQLQELDGRFRAVRSQPNRDDGAMEMLNEPAPSTIRQDDHFGGNSNGRLEPDAGVRYSKPALSRTGSRSPVAEMTRTIRRQSSNISQGNTGEKPRWDVGTRPPPVPTVPPMYQTPSSRRLSTFGPRPPAPRSPTPSSSSVTSGSRISAPGSRIPVRSPPPTGTRSELVVPSFTSSNSHESLLAGTSRRQTLGPDSYLTPTRPRQSVPFSLPRSTTPSLAPRSTSYGATLGPGIRSEPRRQLGRNPPSSFRSTTPTPSRPSSRMSASSFLVSAAALNPFEPSKYDLLDQEVQKVIESSECKLFVARLDPALKRGQRKRDDEEWKGEFVFGAGERSSSVKLLKLVGRAMDGGVVRTKVMCRVAGAWQELSAVLKDRQAKAPQSP